tara:strand:- start:2184 stop:2897 length:714 start_codon:yes stop_codon:yes gene_type:complete
MEQTGPQPSVEPSAGRIYVEAGFIFLTTIILFLLIFVLAVFVTAGFGKRAGNDFLELSFIFVMPFSFLLEDRTEGLPVAVRVAWSVVLASPVILAAIIFAWQWCIKSRDASAHMLAAKTSFLASAATAIIFVGCVLEALISVEMHRRGGFSDGLFLSRLGNLSVVPVLGFVLIPLCTLLTFPITYIYATIYLRLVRPYLLRLGWVVDLTALGSLLVRTQVRVQAIHPPRTDGKVWPR